MKFKVGDRVVIGDRIFENDLFEVGTIGRVIDLHEGASFPIVVQNSDGLKEIFKESELELVQQQDNKNKELTFDEVIAWRQPNQSWVGENYIIHTDKYNDITITNKRGGQLGDFIYIQPKLKYILRNSYSFDEAFKLYEKGKIIEKQLWL